MTKPTNTFKDFYENMPAKSQRGFVEAIINACDISERTFYYWLDNPTAIKKPAREKIALLAGQKIDELFTTTQIA